MQLNLPTLSPSTCVSAAIRRLCSHRACAFPAVWNWSEQQFAQAKVTTRKRVFCIPSRATASETVAICEIPPKRALLAALALSARWRVGLDHRADLPGIRVLVVDRLADAGSPHRGVSVATTFGVEVFVDVQGQPVFRGHVHKVVFLLDLVGLQRGTRAGRRPQLPGRSRHCRSAGNAPLIRRSPCSGSGRSRAKGCQGEASVWLMILTPPSSATACSFPDQVQGMFVGSAQLSSTLPFAGFVDVQTVTEILQLVLRQLAQSAEAPQHGGVGCVLVSVISALAG